MLTSIAGLLWPLQAGWTVGMRASDRGKEVSSLHHLCQQEDDVLPLRSMGTPHRRVTITHSIEATSQAVGSGCVHICCIHILC